MTSLIRSSNKSIHDALRVLARDIQSEDGAANAAIAEAADRIAELGTENERLYLENTKLKREIEDVKVVRYSIEDALTRSQHEATSAQAELERENAALRDALKRADLALDDLGIGRAAPVRTIARNALRKEAQP